MLLSLFFSLVLILGILLLFLFFDEFVFIVFDLLLPLYDDLDVDLYPFHLFGSNRQLSVFSSAFKRVMHWRRCFSVTLSFSLKIPVAYSFMFYWLASSSFSMDFLVNVFVAVT